MKKQLKKSIKKPNPKRESEFLHEKGHKLRPVLYNSNFGNTGDFIIENVLYCPKCNLFFKVQTKQLRGFP